MRGLAEFVVIYSGATPGAVRKHLVGIKRRSFLAAGVYWHRKYRAKHFTPAGAREYHYAPRKGQPGSGQSWWAKSTKGRRFRSYTNRKKKQKGHIRPLVWSGLSERLTRIRAVTAKATAKKSNVKVRLRSPGLNRRHPKSNIRMWDEATRVTDAEFEKMADVVEDTLHKKLSKIRDRIRKKI